MTKFTEAMQSVNTKSIHISNEKWTVRTDCYTPLCYCCELRSND